MPPCLQVPPGVWAHASPPGLVSPCIGARFLCMSVCAATPPPVCTHTCAHLHLAGHRSGSPLFVCLLVGTRLGSSCRREGGVLAHTYKQHH